MSTLCARTSCPHAIAAAPLHLTASLRALAVLSSAQRLTQDRKYDHCPHQPPERLHHLLLPLPRTTHPPQLHHLHQLRRTRHLYFISSQVTHRPAIDHASTNTACAQGSSRSLAQCLRLSASTTSSGSASSCLGRAHANQREVGVTTHACRVADRAAKPAYSHCARPTDTNNHVRNDASTFCINTRNR